MTTIQQHKSRMVGLYPHLILRTSRADAIQDKKEDLGWTGNVLFDRMVGSTIHTCTPREVRAASTFLYCIILVRIVNDSFNLDCDLMNTLSLILSMGKLDRIR
jgi:hypothetical protein